MKHVSDIDIQLACQCAPLITGLKASNLLITENGRLVRLLAKLKYSEICYSVLCADERRTVLLLYKPGQLEQFLKIRQVKETLEQMGYPSKSLAESLMLLAARYEEYRLQKKRFPHEIGLFLEYPPEDVLGFIENDGKNYLLTGYWKVYGNAAEKISMFRAYEESKRFLVKMVLSGVKIEDIV